jgi:phosphoribosyl-AMP cyclohydrolase
MNLDRLRFDEHGLVPAVIQSADDGAVLMLGYMSRESLLRTLEERRTVFWSRSRRALWRKGDTSGHAQHVVEVRADCDGDALLVRVHQIGAACHTGERSCFVDEVDSG